NSDAVRRDFMNRFPLRADQFVTIPNGFDPEEFSTIQPRRLVGPEQLVLTHAGCFYARRRPDSLFQALRLLLDRGVQAGRVILQLVGETAYEGTPLTAIAAKYGVEQQGLLPAQVPHKQALEYLSGSHIQLLVGFRGAGSELQGPAKLFEYIGIGKPVLAMAPKQSAITEVVKLMGSAAEMCDPDDPEQIAAAVQRLADTVEKRRSATPDNGSATASSSSAVACFHRRPQVRRLAELLSVADTHT